MPISRRPFDALDDVGIVHVPVTGSATVDCAAINAACLALKTDYGGGTVVIGPGTITMSSSADRILIRGGITLLGAGIFGTKIVAPAGASTFAMFSHEEASVSWYWKLDDIWLTGYSSDCQAINSDVGGNAVWDIHIGRSVYIDGFGDGNGANTNAVVYLGDPWGFRFNGIIEQSGARPALVVEATTSSTDNCVISQAKITNNAGEALKIIGVGFPNIKDCILGSNGDNKSVVTLTNCSHAMIAGNMLRGKSTSSGQIGFDLTGTTTGTQSRNNTLISNGASSCTAVRVGASCSLNSFEDSIGPWTTSITDSAGDTVFRLQTGTAEASRVGEHIGYAANSYYYPGGFVGALGASALSATIVYLVPIFIGERTNFVRIGANCTTGVGGSTLRLGVYRAANGIPTTLVSGSDAGTLDTASSGVKESTIDITLSRGWYFLAVTSSAAISLTSQLNADVSVLIGDATAVTGDSTPYLAPGSYGALASTAGTMARGNTAQTLNVLWLRRG